MFLEALEQIITILLQMCMIMLLYLILNLNLILNTLF